MNIYIYMCVFPNRVENGKKSTQPHQTAKHASLFYAVGFAAVFDPDVHWIWFLSHGTLPKTKSGGVTLGFHPVDVTTEYTVSRNHPAPKEDLGWQEKQGSVS